MVIKHSDLVREFTMPAKQVDKIKGKGELAREHQIRTYAARGLSTDQILLHVFNIPLPLELEAMAMREEQNRPPASHSLAAQQPSEVYAKRKKVALQFISRVLNEVDDGE